MKKNAELSDCEKYRYKLSRIWDESKPKILFIMLNPSKADEKNDDPTLIRCINFAKNWGYGGLYVGNLFPYRASDPTELLRQQNPSGENNLKYLLEMKENCEDVVCAWGQNLGMPEWIKNNFENLKYIELSKNETPKHPLYLKGNLKLKSILS